MRGILASFRPVGFNFAKSSSSRLYSYAWFAGFFTSGSASFALMELSAPPDNRAAWPEAAGVDGDVR
jgi:cytosine/uracil/thiamine/allantoin permease